MVAFGLMAYRYYMNNKAIAVGHCGISAVPAASGGHRVQAVAGLSGGADGHLREAETDGTDGAGDAEHRGRNEPDAELYQ